ncbi:hypothetical protein D9M69_634600 [compost metagenome]
MGGLVKGPVHGPIALHQDWPVLAGDQFVEEAVDLRAHCLLADFGCRLEFRDLAGFCRAVGNGPVHPAHADRVIGGHGVFEHQGEVLAQDRGSADDGLHMAMRTFGGHHQEYLALAKIPPDQLVAIDPQLDAGGHDILQISGSLADEAAFA